MKAGVLSGMGFAIVGALLPMPYAAAAYEQANAVTCCENPRVGAFVIGLFFIPVAVLALTPVMIGCSRMVRSFPRPSRAGALIAIGMALGALIGWALFQLSLLPAEMGLEEHSTWGIVPGALVGGGAAIGWWFGTDGLGPRKKVKNG